MKCVPAIYSGRLFWEFHQIRDDEDATIQELRRVVEHLVPDANIRVNFHRTSLKESKK